MTQPALSLPASLEQWLLSLGQSGAIPVAELVRILERTAERLRSGSDSGPPPEDLVSQSQAARMVEVSRQAVHQWVSKGLVRLYTVPGANGRPAGLVSLSEVAVAASRGRDSVFTATLRRQFEAFLGRAEEHLPADLLAGLAAAVDPKELPERVEDASRVLREFVTAAMGSSAEQREFTEAGVHMLGRLSPLHVVDPGSSFGGLAESLGLLVHSATGSAGFDSSATAILGILGCATVGVSLRGPRSGIASALALAAQDTWGDDWVTRLLDLAYRLEQMSASSLTRYTASLTYLGTNSFYRQAQPAGVSIAYSRTPGLIAPQNFFGEPALSSMLRRGVGDPGPSFNGAAVRLGARALSDTNVNPFRHFIFERGLLDTSIHGIRRYCYSTVDARALVRSYAASLTRTQRARYVELSIANLARAIELPFMEVVAIDEPGDFDWWKDHVMRSSEREIIVGLRDERARRVAHALLVQTALLPDVIEAAETDNSLRDRLRVYVKNLEFDIVNDRYQDDLRRGAARLVTSVTEKVDADESRVRAEAEITGLLRD